MSSVLYVPPADRPDVLAPSVGGTLPPMWGCMNRYQPPDYDVPVPDPWGSLVGCPDWPKFSERALLLSLEGVPDAIGMGRALAILLDSLKSTEPTGETNAMHPTYWVDYEEDGDCDFGSNPSYPSALCVAHDGVFWRLDLPDEMPDEMPDAKIVGGMLAHLAGGSVVVTS